MTPILRALRNINTALEALELLEIKDVADRVSDECIVMLMGKAREEIASQSEFIRSELHRRGEVA